MTQMVMFIPSTRVGHLQVSVYIQAEILSAEAVRHKANFWLLENMDDLVRAESPKLFVGFKGAED